MAKVTGFGGIFFKTDKKATAEWFTKNLGVATEEWGAMMPVKDYAVLGLHAKDTDYFGPSKQPFMLNLRVDDLEGLLADLRAKGVEIIKVLPPDPYGQFAHIAGPEGITIELWQPKDETKA